MSRKTSFEADLSLSAHINYYDTSPKDAYSYKQYPKNYDKFSSKVQDRKAL